jgi:HSP20 family molecular chaperone IbpA
MNGLRAFTETIGEVVLDGVGRVSARVQERKPLPADLLESDEAYLVVFDAPGAEMQDVSVTYERGTVTVRIERFRDLHEGYEMLFPGRGLTLEGRVDLPEDAGVDAEGANATLTTNGTLRVEIPKEEPEAGGPVRIDTEEGAGPTDDSMSAGDSTAAGDATTTDDSASAGDDATSASQSVDRGGDTDDAGVEEAVEELADEDQEPGAEGADGDAAEDDPDS